MHSRIFEIVQVQNETFLMIFKHLAAPPLRKRQICMEQTKSCRWRRSDRAGLVGVCLCFIQMIVKFLHLLLVNAFCIPLARNAQKLKFLGTNLCSNSSSIRYYYDKETAAALLKAYFRVHFVCLEECFHKTKSPLQTSQWKNGLGSNFCFIS